MIFGTARLELHKLTPADVDFIFELLNTPTWIKHIGDRGIKSLEHAADYIITGPMASYNKHGFGLWLMKLKTTQNPIGLCGLIKRDYLDDPDIGFALLPEYTGKGYATEAARGVMHLAFQELNLTKLLAFTSSDNQLSIAVIQKLGMKYMDMISIPNDPEKLMLFGISKTETENSHLTIPK